MCLVFVKDNAHGADGRRKPSRTIQMKRASGLAGFVPGPTHPHGFPSHQFGKVRDRSDRTAKKENHHVHVVHSKQGLETPPAPAPRDEGRVGLLHSSPEGRTQFHHTRQRCTNPHAHI